MTLVRTTRGAPVRWTLGDDPFSAIDRLFQDLGGSVGNRDDAYYPMDLYENDDASVIELAVPGVKPDDLDISVEGRQFTIRASLPAVPEGEQRRYWLQAIPRGALTRTVRLPANVDVDAVQASVADGMLTLRMGKAAEAKVRKIEIQPLLIAPSASGAVPPHGPQRGGRPRTPEQLTRHLEDLGRLAALPQVRVPAPDLDVWVRIVLRTVGGLDRAGVAGEPDDLALRHARADLDLRRDAREVRVAGHEAPGCSSHTCMPRSRSSMSPGVIITVREARMTSSYSARVIST
jgi:HSP20 family protein